MLPDIAAAVATGVIEVRDVDISGGSRNLERGVQPRANEAHPKIFGLPRPFPVILMHVVATDW